LPARRQVSWTKEQFMDKKQQITTTSLVGRILSLETVLVLVALFFLYSGFRTGEATQIFWGIMIGVGAVALYFVRRKDWKQHWEEQERMRQALEEARRREKGPEK
jgi:hypothetical protein